MFDQKTKLHTSATFKKWRLKVAPRFTAQSINLGGHSNRSPYLLVLLG